MLSQKYTGMKLLKKIIWFLSNKCKECGAPNKDWHGHYHFNECKNVKVITIN
jgi:hypothetical protein